MAKLELWFERADSGPALSSTVFDRDEKDPLRTDRYSDDIPVRWTRGVMAHMWLLVTSAISARSNEELRWTCVVKGTPLNSVHELARRPSEWRKRVFGDLWIEDLISLKTINHKPYRRLNETVLKPEEIHIYLDGTLVVDATALEKLADDILAQFESRRRTSREAIRRAEHPGASSSPHTDTEDTTDDVELRLYFDHLIASHTRLFAGRRRETGQIIEYVKGTGHGYIFIEGLSGYGKTSLLARLVCDHPDFAYHFISQAYKTSGGDFDPTQFDSLLANLCEQLEAIGLGTIDSRSPRARFQHFLTTPVRQRSVVIVIDAIDEVDKHPNYLFGLLPPKLPMGVTVILSARSQGDRCYLAEVGLDRDAIALHIQLEGLGPNDIGQLLQLVGGKGVAAGNDPDFVEKLHQISAGDPFYLRFLAEDIARGSITPSNVHRTPSGLYEYLDRQFCQLDRSAYLSQQRDTLGLILAAEAPLSRTDLLKLVEGLDGLNFDNVLRDIHRFLLAQDDTYTFCHRRFKEYFASKM